MICFVSGRIWAYVCNEFEFNVIPNTREIVVGSYEFGTVFLYTIIVQLQQLLSRTNKGPIDNIIVVRSIDPLLFSRFI